MSISIGRNDLVLVEPPAAFSDVFRVALDGPFALKHVLRTQALFTAGAAERLRASDRIEILRFVDAGRQRLAEMATLTIAQSYSGGRVDYKTITIVQMPAPPKDIEPTVDDAMVVDRIDHGFAVVPEFEPANGTSCWLVRDGDNTLESFKNEFAAQQHCDYVRASQPDWIVRERDGSILSPRFANRQDAETWRAHEVTRRQMGGGESPVPGRA